VSALVTDATVVTLFLGYYNHMNMPDAAVLYNKNKVCIERVLFICDCARDVSLCGQLLFCLWYKFILMWVLFQFWACSLCIHSVIICNKMNCVPVQVLPHVRKVGLVARYMKVVVYLRHLFLNAKGCIEFLVLFYIV
jgi:hypothetical protein